MVHFVHPSLELVPLFTDMRGRSIKKISKRNSHQNGYEMHRKTESFHEYKNEAKSMF